MKWSKRKERKWKRAVDRAWVSMKCKGNPYRPYKPVITWRG